MNDYNSFENQCLRLLDRRRKYEQAREEIDTEIQLKVRSIEKLRSGRLPEVVRWDIDGRTAEVRAGWASPSSGEHGQICFPLEMVYSREAFELWYRALEAGSENL